MGRRGILEMLRVIQGKLECNELLLKENAAT